MYKILIVDDEFNERRGIQGLICKYQYPLEVRQAQNGKIALEMMEKEEFDILLTDIKMPFMTGIELIEQVNKRGWHPICIIYSAYGEFEYAQNAIQLGVLQYLLKPIKLEKFQDVFQNVIEICKEKRTQKFKNEQLKKTLKSIECEKYAQKIIRYLELEECEESFDKFNETIQNEAFYPIIISLYSSSIFKYWENYEEDILNVVGEESLIINKSDTQFLILIRNRTLNSKQMDEICKTFIEFSKNKYQSEIYVVAGQFCKDIKELKEEYTKMLNQLDYQFFVSKSMYFINNENGIIRKKSEMLYLYYERILTFAKLKDYHGMNDEFKKAFKYVEESEGFTSLYIKYNFSEVIKKCCEILNSEERMMEIVEDIYGASSICQVKTAIFNLIETLAKTGKEKNKENRLIVLAKSIVNERFSDYNLNVSQIAEDMNMSAAYLSTLFKVETKQNLAKYISQYRLEKAKDLLKTTNMKIADISKKVGYMNPSYFILLFKNNVGCSPAKYREKFFKNE
ncbi:response regulator [Clostridioides difficile]